MIKVLPPISYEERKESTEHFMSASQLVSYRTCKLCWAWRYLDGIKKPDTEAIEQGHAIHEILENYFNKGTPIDFKSPLGQIIEPGMEYLPKEALAEHPFLVEIDKIRYLGSIDFLVKHGKHIIIGDHKTTKNFKYAKSKNALAKDPQANIYAAYACTAFNVPAVELNWVYYCTGEDDIKSKLVSSEIYLTDALEFVKILNKDAKEIIRLKESGTRAADLLATCPECRGFGKDNPCAYREIRKMADQNKPNIKDFLKKQKGEQMPLGINPPSKAAMPVVEKEPEQPMENPPKKAVAALEQPKTGTPGLYIDCFPTKTSGRNIELTDLLTPIQKELEKIHEVDHYRLIEYGKGSAFIAQALEAYLVENKADLIGINILTTQGTQEGRDTLDVLKYFCFPVVETKGR